MLPCSERGDKWKFLQQENGITCCYPSYPSRLDPRDTADIPRVATLTVLYLFPLEYKPWYLHLPEGDALWSRTRISLSGKGKKQIMNMEWDVFMPWAGNEFLGWSEVLLSWCLCYLATWSKQHSWLMWICCKLVWMTFCFGVRFFYF